MLGFVGFLCAVGLAMDGRYLSAFIMGWLALVSPL